MIVANWHGVGVGRTEGVHCGSSTPAMDPDGQSRSRRFEWSQGVSLTLLIDFVKELARKRE